MKALISIWITLATVTAHAANPSFRDLAWTNNAGLIRLRTNAPIDFSTNGQQDSSWLSALWDDQSSLPPMTFLKQSSNAVSGSSLFTFWGQNGSADNDAIRVRLLRVRNNSGVAPDNPPASIIYDGRGAFSVYADLNGASGQSTSEGIAVYGLGEGNFIRQFGVVGLSITARDDGVSVGTTGLAFDDGPNNNVTNIGGYFEVRKDFSQDSPVWQKSVMLIDNRETGVPLFIARTNNGSFTAFEVGGTRTTNTTPFDVAGAATLFSGSYYPSNAITVATISEGMTNGAFWVGTLSNALQAVWMSNNVTLFKKLAP